eukprot:360374-Chlamydomonas_euryale.AAC.2
MPSRARPWVWKLPWQTAGRPVQLKHWRLRFSSLQESAWGGCSHVRPTTAVTSQLSLHSCHIHLYGSCVSHAHALPEQTFCCLRNPTKPYETLRNPCTPRCHALMRCFLHCPCVPTHVHALFLDQGSCTSLHAPHASRDSGGE